MNRDILIDILYNTVIPSIMNCKNSKYNMAININNIETEPGCSYSKTIQSVSIPDFGCIKNEIQDLFNRLKLQLQLHNINYNIIDNIIKTFDFNDFAVYVQNDLSVTSNNYTKINTSCPEYCSK